MMQQVMIGLSVYAVALTIGWAGMDRVRGRRSRIGGGYPYFWTNRVEDALERRANAAFDAAKERSLLGSVMTYLTVIFLYAAVMLIAYAIYLPTVGVVIHCRELLKSG